MRVGYTEEKMANYMRQDLIDGVEGVKCGIIGEVGTAWPITGEFGKRLCFMSFDLCETYHFFCLLSRITNNFSEDLGIYA